MTDIDTSLRLELFVRSLGPRTARQPLDAVIARLERLAATDLVTEYSLHVWGDRLCPSSPIARTQTGRFVTERVRTFRRWAAENDRDLQPFISETTCHSALLDESFTEWTLPEMGLAVFDDDALVMVAPHRVDGSVLGVHGLLDRLERGTVTDERGQPSLRPQKAAAKR